jgi:serine/threonine protein kinase
VHKLLYLKGEQIYKYQLQDKIGGGNFGVVWTAVDMTLKTDLAIKLLDQTQYSIDERLLEAQIGNRLQHANVVNIKWADVIEKDNVPIVVIAMPFYSNGSVLSQLNSQNFLDLGNSIKCLIDVLRGLDYLHENGYYHCDIKPNNILIGDKGEYLISDYGITCFSPNHTAVQPRQCYLPHTSPETIIGNIYDVRTDIYQLGLTAFRLVNGVTEIKDDYNRDRDQFQKDVLAGKVITDSKYKPHVPRSIRRIINKATATDPNDRFQTALEMRRALEKIKLMGNCTADENGNIIVLNSGCAYRFEINKVTENEYELNVFKKNLKSGNETKSHKYCVNKLLGKNVKATIQAVCFDLI